MINFYRAKSFQIPTVMKNGVGILSEQLSQELKNLGVSKPLLVTDKGVREAGIIEKVTDILEENNINYAIYDRVKANPSVETVGKGTESFTENDCDGLIAVGGGSSIDTAKGIGVEVTHKGSILDYEVGKNPLTERICPLIAIPTTAGTGSEVTLWAVITDPEREYKFNVGGPLLAPHVAIVDAKLHVSLPGEITAQTGMDALCHAIECYTSHYAQPVTDAVALQAIEYCSKYLRRAVTNHQDIEARYYMAMAAHLAGLSYGEESAGAVHAMSHTLGGIKPDISHGAAVGALLAPVMKFNWMGEPGKFKKIAQALGKDIRGLDEREASLKSVEAVENLAEDIGIPTLKELGVTEEEIPKLAKAAEEDPQTVGNPWDLDKEGYEEIYRSALNS